MLMSLVGSDMFIRDSTPVDNASVYEILCYDKFVVTAGAVAYYEEELK